MAGTEYNLKPDSSISDPESSALWPAVSRLRRDSGELEFYCCRISVVKQGKPLQRSQSKILNKMYLLATNRWLKILRTLSTNHRPVTSVGRVLDYRAGGGGFKPRPDQPLGSLNN